MGDRNSRISTITHPSRHKAKLLWRDNYQNKAAMTSPLERIKEVNYNVWFLNFPRRAAVNITMRKRQTLVVEKKKKDKGDEWAIPKRK